MQYITITKTEKMKTGSYEVLDEPIRHWYLPMVLGFVLIVVGIWVALTPVASFIGLSVLFTISFLITGALETMHSIVNRKELSNWGWSLIVGILDLLIGVLLASKPAISMALLPYFVGFGLMFRCVLAIGWSITLKDLGISDWKNLLFIGILGTLFSFVSLWDPVFFSLTLVFYVAAAFILVGCFNIYLSLKLKKL